MSSLWRGDSMGNRQRQIVMNMTLKEKVMKILADNNMTVQELADSINRSVPAVSLLLRRGNPSLEKLQRIADGLGVPLASLVDEDYEERDNSITCPYCGKAIKFTAEKA